MKRRRFLLLLILFLLCGLGYGQPYTGFIYPSGGGRGTTFTAEVGGHDIQNTSGVHCSNKGIRGEFIHNLPDFEKQRFKQVKDQDNLQLTERVELKITIDKNVRPGIYDLRLITKDGLSNRLFFEVGQLSEYKEKKNSTIPFVGPLPIEINGQIFPGEKDNYRFHAKKGQTIVCAVKARVLVPYIADAVPGWFQPVLTLFNENGKEIAFNDDFQNQPDPVLVHQIKETGNYTLQIHDAIFRGRSDFVYRISLGEIPYLYSVFPLGGQVGKTVKFKLNGINLKEKEYTIRLPDRGEKVRIYGVGEDEILSNSKPLQVSKLQEITELDNNGSFKQAEKIRIPTIINGKIKHKDDTDWFQFEAKKGERLSFKINGRRLQSPIDAQLALYDTQKRQLAISDDYIDQSDGMAIHHADPLLIHRFQRQGIYFIRLLDIQGKGGKDYNYRLIVQKPQPDFELRIEPSNLMLPKGGSAAFKVHALRKAGFSGDINLAFSEIPEGFLYKKRTIKKGQKYVQMTISAPGKVQPGPVNLAIEGTSTQNGVVVQRKALPAEEKMQAFIYLHLMPTDDFPVRVVKANPYKIKTKVLEDKCDYTVSPQKMVVEAELNFIREWKRSVRLQLHNPAVGMRMKPITLEQGETKAEIEIEFFRNIKQNDYSPIIKGVSFVGRGKGKNRKTLEVLSPVIPVMPAIFNTK